MTTMTTMTRFDRCLSLSIDALHTAIAQAQNEAVKRALQKRLRKMERKIPK